MNVLIACEESQRVCTAFREKGHRAFSCDILDCSGGHPEWHIKGDVLPLLNGRCEFTLQNGLIIAHPPCTDLCVSGARWFAEKQKDLRQQKAVAFFMHFALANCDRICIENPVGIMSNVYKKPSQIIQPWWFGDNYSKSTCLWLKGLAPLKPETIKQPEIEFVEWTDAKTGKKKRQDKFSADALKLPPEERARLRSQTFPGIARAMSEQWG